MSHLPEGAPRGRRDRGAILPLVAIIVPVLLVMTAFAVDLGRQRSVRRTMQARADVIALDMVRLANGRTESAILADPQYTAYLTGAAARNEATRLLDAGDLVVDFGTWTDVSGFIPTAPTGIPDAVRVRADDEFEYAFQPGTGTASRSAVAAFGEPKAGFSIGSFGANLSTSNSGMLNSILTPILGNPAGISALSYQGLAGADIGVGDLAAELGLLTPESALDTDVGTETFLLAAAKVLERNGDTANATVLRNMITAQVTAFGPISIGDVVSAETGAEESALQGSVNVLDLLTATAFASRCTDPQDLGTCSALSLPDISTDLPIADTSGSARLIQGKVSHYGRVGTGTSTSQTELRVTTKVNSQNVGKCTPANILDLKCVLGGVLGTIDFVDATVTLDATVKLADGRGDIAAIDCGTPQRLDVSTSTGLYSVTGTVTIDFGKRGLLGGALGPLIGSLTLAFDTSQANVSDLAQFDVPPDVLGVTVEETGSGDVGLANVALSTTGSTGVLGTLGDLGVTNTLAPLMSLLVNPLLHELDNDVLGPLTDLLGLNVAGSDISPLAIGCNSGVRLVG
ncbi:MAG: pilus assembly protein TadG-related protein [Acidimicrobiales bacterium]|nr:pilus assembly protein TadG-related protein [Acidimicrobiales bacterium]